MKQFEKVSGSDVLFIGDEIGSGSHGWIRPGFLLTKGIRVAIKQFYGRDIDEEEDAGHLDAKDLLLHEAKMMARLSHPNIISLHAIVFKGDKVDGKAGLLMDYMPDRDVGRFVLNDDDFQSLDWPERVKIASCVAAALEYMHSIGIIHFDLQGSNVLLNRYPTESGVHVECKVSDFALAREKKGDMSFMHGQGTQNWMAPEMKYEGIITEKVDVFPFGLLMYQLLTGYEPYPIYLTLNEVVVLPEPQRHKKVRRRSFQPWVALMYDCLAWNASCRPSFAEVRMKLTEILASLEKRRMSNNLPITIEDDDKNVAESRIEDDDTAGIRPSLSDVSKKLKEIVASIEQGHGMKRPPGMIEHDDKKRPRRSILVAEVSEKLKEIVASLGEEENSIHYDCEDEDGDEFEI